MLTPAQICAAQRRYEYRLERELERLMEAEDETNYCSGDCATCDIPYCCVSSSTNNDNQEKEEQLWLR